MTTPGEVSGVIDVLQTLPSAQLFRDTAWDLKMATIIGVSLGSTVIGVFDGDGINGGPSTSVPMILLVDSVAIGDHVLVLSVPPNGNYIIRNGTGGNAPSQNSIYFAPDSQTDNVGTFKDMLLGGNPATFSFVKFRDNSRVAVHHSLSGYISGTNTRVETALDFNGTQYTVSSREINPNLQHTSWGSDFHIPQEGDPALPAGEYTVTIQFRRSAGSGTVTFDQNNRVSCLLVEAPPA